MVLENQRIVVRSGEVSPLESQKWVFAEICISEPGPNFWKEGRVDEMVIPQGFEPNQCFTSRYVKTSYGPFWLHNSRARLVEVLEMRVVCKNS